MKVFKTILNAIIIILALQALFVTVNITLSGVISIGNSFSSSIGVGKLTPQELMYPLFFIASIFYYKKMNEKPMLFVATIGLLSKLILYVFILLTNRG